MKIAKAHGLGNDFLLAREKDCPSEPAAWARRLCDRHVGIGADGVLVHGVTDGVVRMRLLNADGSEAEISGNGLRCLGAYAFRGGKVPARHLILTAAGPKSVSVRSKGGNRFEVETDLGPPILGSREIPVALDPPTDQVVDHPLEAGGRSVAVTATSLGNPHCALFLDGPADDNLLETLGPELERHAFFPRRTNVEFVHVTRRDELRVRFWERGVGRTRASGTGAASAVVAAILGGRAERKARVTCDGGVLEVEWPEAGHVRQTGEVEILFEGEWLAG